MGNGNIETTTLTNVRDQAITTATCALEGDGLPGTVGYVWRGDGVAVRVDLDVIPLEQRSPEVLVAALRGAAGGLGVLGLVVVFYALSNEVGVRPGFMVWSFDGCDVDCRGYVLVDGRVVRAGGRGSVDLSFLEGVVVPESGVMA